MSDEQEAPKRTLTMVELEEERIVSGTPERPAWCNTCEAYTKIFNLCSQCGRDERPRYGCRHRIGIGGICNECRQEQIAQETSNAHDVTHLPALVSLLRRFASLNRSPKNMNKLLALQVEASGLLRELEDTL